MTLFAAPNNSADKPRVNTVETPQTEITTQADQTHANETTAETAFVGEVSEAETDIKAEETIVTESETEPSETEVFTEEKTSTEHELETEDCTEITEETIKTEPDEETVECIDEGNQSLAEYKPQTGGQPNPFENDTPTEIDDRPVEDYVVKGEDRPGEGKHF